MPEYPEHEKLAKVAEDSQRLGAFLDWASERGYGFAHWVESDFSIRSHTSEDPEEHVRHGHEDRYVPVHKSIQQWLAEFYEIDLSVIEEEKRQMLDEIRQANDTARAIDEAARA